MHILKGSIHGKYGKKGIIFLLYYSNIINTLISECVTIESYLFWGTNNSIIIILDSERSDECIEFTMMFFYFCV
jgi:hypothetical protein